MADGEILPAAAQRTPEVAAAQLAHERQERIFARAKAMRKLWVALAGDFYEFIDRRQYRDLGYHTFDEWLAEADLDIGRRQIFKLTEIYRTMVVERGVEPEKLEGIRITKAYAVLDATRRGQVSVQDALADAEVLPLDDLKKRYRPKTSDVTTIEEPLDAEREPAPSIPPDPSEIPPTPIRRRVCSECGRELAA